MELNSVLMKIRNIFEEYEEYLKLKGVKLIEARVKHPQSNGGTTQSVNFVV